MSNLRYRANDVNIACKCVLSVIEETDAILPEYENVSDSKEHVDNYDMANNIFWNAVSVCNSLFQKGSQEPFDLTGRITELLAKYDCFSIFLRLSSLNSANLRGAKLDHADLSDADLDDANLHITDLRGADLRNASLNAADLHGADLSGADLSDAKLYSADLSRADLSDTILRGADLCEADLCDADLFEANFENAQVLKKLYAYLSNKNVKNLNKTIIVDDE